MPVEVAVLPPFVDERERIRAEVAGEIADWILQGVVDEAYGGDLLKLTLARQIRKRYGA